MRGLRRVLKAHWGKIACLAFGVGLVLGGCYYLWDQYRFAVTAARADGTIVAVDEQTTGGELSGTTHCPVIRFRTEGQQAVQFTDRTCSNPAPRIGVTVDVLYDPDHPRRAQVGVTSEFVIGGVFTIIGLLFATGAVHSIVRALSRRRGQQREGRIQDKPRPQDPDTA